jgi:hypothetical protein
MFGLTTTRRTRAAELRARRATSDADRRDILLGRFRRQAEADRKRIAHLHARLDANSELLVSALSEAMTERARATKTTDVYQRRLLRALRACARYRAQLPQDRPVQHPDELWSLIDWSLWGSGMGDTFREQLADQFIAAITPEQHRQALDLIRWWTEDRGREPLGRRRYEEQQERLHRALRAVARWRAEAAREHRALRFLAEQLLDATSGESASARHTLGLTVTPWERAVEGLNALTTAGISFHVEPDGHISNPFGDEHIEWDHATQRWRLVHDDEAGTA